MKRKFFAFILLLTAGLSLSSCLSSDDDTTIEYTHDTAITAFSLGTMTRYYQGVSSNTGNDTTFSAEVTGSKYKFYIDQATRQIYNPDSLPLGTKVSAVLATITAKNSSPVVLQDVNKSDSLIYYSSSDSIDFSSPRKIRVYNNDFSAYSTYTVTVNVHKEDPDSFVWRSLGSRNAELASLLDMKVVSAGNNIFLFGKTAAGTKIYKTRNTDGASWSTITPSVSLGQDAYLSAVAKDDALYILNNGTVLKSTDANTWETVATDASLKQLIGAGSQYLYAYTQNMGVAVSKDNGATWSAEGMDADASYLPTENLSMAIRPVLSTKNAETLLLMGKRDAAKGDSIATLWMRTADYNAEAEAGQWNYVDYDANQLGKLPYLKNIQVAANDSGFVAMGAGRFVENSIEVNRFKWYVSKTGLTWKVDTTVACPTGFAFDLPAALVRDNNHYYWIVNNGMVWKGRYNRDGWRKE